MTTSTATQGVRVLVQELADTEDQLRAIRFEPMTAECRARRKAITVKQARLIHQLRVRRDATSKR